jgi:hypothetical protein
VLAGLWLVIPFAGTAIVVTELPLSFTVALTATSLKDVVRTARARTWKQRISAGVAVLVLAVVGATLGAFAVSAGLVDLLGGTANRQVRYYAGLGLALACSVVLTAMSRVVLGVLANRSSHAPTTPHPVHRPLPRPDRQNATSWPRSRLAATAVLVTSSLIIQLMGVAVFTVPASANERKGPVVTTLDDGTDIIDGECDVDQINPCRLRTALAIASSQDDVPGVPSSSASSSPAPSTWTTPSRSAAASRSTAPPEARPLAATSPSTPTTPSRSCTR